jgi:hypothetical protein
MTYLLCYRAISGHGVDYLERSQDSSNDLLYLGSKYFLNTEIVSAYVLPYGDFGTAHCSEFCPCKASRSKIFT